MTQKRGIYGRHAAWPITCPSFRKNSKYRCGNNEQVCAQGTVPPPPPPSPPPFPSQLPSYLTRLTSVCLLVCCLSPSWECPLPKSRNLAWLAHPISPRGLRPSLAGRYILCGMSFLGPGQESLSYKSRSMRKDKIQVQKLILSLEKDCNCYTQGEYTFNRTHTCFQPAQTWALLGQRNNPPPTTSHYYQASTFCQYLGEPLSEDRATFFTQMQSGWEAEGSNSRRLRKNTTVIIYVMKRLIAGCCAETRCNGTIPITLIIIIKRAFTSHDKKLQI